MIRSKLAQHLELDTFGSFRLTSAIRPALRNAVVPRAGYKRSLFRDQQYEIPYLTAAVSREVLFDLFLDLLTPLGDEVQAILESSHSTGQGKHKDFAREQIDLPVLKSYLCDFEDLLLNDGCTGVAVLSRAKQIEIQFDEHKLLTVYGKKLGTFERLFQQAGLTHDPQLPLITQGEHIHVSEVQHEDEFEQFCYRLGVGAEAEAVNW